MEQQEQIANELSDLTDQLGRQIDSTERSLERTWSAPRLDADAELESINKFLEDIRKHRGFVWLTKRPEFSETLALFEKTINALEKSEFNIARMKVRLLKAISASGYQILNDSSWLPRTISKKDKKRATEVALELLAFVQNETGRRDAKIMRDLQKPLSRFVSELREQTSSEYMGPNYRQEDTATNFIVHIRNFGLDKRHQVELLESTFSIFGAELGHRTAQNYVNKGLER